MRVVLDSNIWVSAVQFGGVPRTAIEIANMQDEVIFCRQLEDEIIATLAVKFAASYDKTRRQIDLLAESATWVSLKGLVSGISRDPNDDFILECATVGNAALIVTGDKDLLSLGQYEGIRILTPRQYLDERRA
jgi:putative PIN family toxin of toxin-antitoxin system